MPNEMTAEDLAKRLGDIKEQILENISFDDARTLDYSVSALRRVASGELAEAKHGQWIYSRSVSEFSVSKCSVCGKEQFSISNVVAEGRYCPACGALMDGKDDSHV